MNILKPMKHKLFIFDLDGTLVDTNMANFMSYKQSLSVVDYVLSYEMFEQCIIGKHWKKFLPLLLNSNDTILIDKIHHQKIKLFKSFLTQIKLNLGLINLIKHLKGDGYISLATTASKINCYDILKYFQIINLFDHIVTGDDVKKTKPHPDCYKICMDKFKAKKENTFIFEDSETGIKAANIIVINFKTSF